MVVRRIVARAELSQQEMLVIFSMVAVGSAFTGHDNMPRLMGQMPYAHRFASPENDWRALSFTIYPTGSSFLIQLQFKTSTRGIRIFSQTAIWSIG